MLPASMDIGRPRASVITPTHDPRWLADTWRSLKNQTMRDFEWVVACNAADGSEASVKAVMGRVMEIVGDDPRVTIYANNLSFTGIGERKNHAFSRGKGEILVELDHDDLLAPTCLEKLLAAFDSDPAIGFVWSNAADFPDDRKYPTEITYHHEGQRNGSLKDNGWSYAELELGAWVSEYNLPRKQLAPSPTFEPTALSMSLIYYCPNHVRAWRASVYREIGGHNKGLPVGDDHDLVVRAYLASKVKKVDEVLYLYRVSGDNAWLQSTDKIREITYGLQRQYLEKLVLRECELRGEPAYDLGGGLAPQPGWTCVDADLDGGPGIVADLTKRWPFEDSSVGAFRAADLLEHLPDKRHTMSEIHRCLRPGGWLLSSTPSTDGRGAHQDPTHESYWNQNSFWYWTRGQQARFIRNKTVRFQEVELFTIVTDQENMIAYVIASLVCLKDGYSGPGVVKI